MCKLAGMKGFVMLIKLFLCMMFIHCNGLLLASEPEPHEIFNQCIEIYINGVDIEDQITSDEDKQISVTVMKAVEHFHESRENILGFTNIVQSSKMHDYGYRVAWGIALYHRAHRDVIFNNQYKLVIDHLIFGRDAAQLTLRNIPR